MVITKFHARPKNVEFKGFFAVVIILPGFQVKCKTIDTVSRQGRRTRIILKQHLPMFGCRAEQTRNIGSRNFQEAESGIGVGRHLEKRGNGPKGVQESSVIGGLEIPRDYELD